MLLLSAELFLDCEVAAETVAFSALHDLSLRLRSMLLLCLEIVKFCYSNMVYFSDIRHYNIQFNLVKAM